MRAFARFAAVIAVLAALACGDAALPTPPAAPFAQTSAATQAQSFIVVFRDGTRDVPGLAASLAADHAGEISHIYQHAIQGFAARLPVQAVASLLRNPDVAFVEPDAELTATTTQWGATWGLDRIDQRKLPLNMTYTYHADGSGVRVYVIDTGVRTTHEEFGGRATFGFTAFPNDIVTPTCGWHGTHVAGTIGGTVYGVAKQVSLVDVQVIDCAGHGTVSTGIAGVDWVTGNHVKPAVANMSVAASSISAAFDLSVENSIAAGVTYVIAAGNDNDDACNYSPARVASAITVGSTTRSDAKAPTSNYGSCLDLFAPGEGITSASSWSDASIEDMSGTSAAAPHAAGVAALVLEDNPSLTPSGAGRLIITNATTGKVKRPGPASPSRLLYSGFVGSVVRTPD